MALKKDSATILILLIGEASGVFAGFCPSWFLPELHHFSMIKRQRPGMLTGFAQAR